MKLSTFFESQQSAKRALLVLQQALMFDAAGIETTAEYYQVIFEEGGERLTLRVFFNHDVVCYKFKSKSLLTEIARVSHANVDQLIKEISVVTVEIDWAGDDDADTKAKLGVRIKDTLDDQGMKGTTLQIMSMSGPGGYPVVRLTGLRARLKHWLEVYGLFDDDIETYIV